VTVEPPGSDAAEANIAFAISLYHRLAADTRQENVFFSPYSVFTALMMVAEGARGKTAAEMGKVLCLPKPQQPGGDGPQLVPWNVAAMHAGMAALDRRLNAANQPASKEGEQEIAALRKELETLKQQVDQLKGDAFWKVVERSREVAAEINRLVSEVNPYEVRTANALWGDRAYPFKQSFLDTIRQHYGGGMFTVDFSNQYEGARQRINAWVEQQTHQRIKNLIAKGVLDQVAQDRLALIVTSAIYFRGRWAEAFDPEDTQDADFTLSGGQKVRVPMMHGDGIRSAGYAAFNGDGSKFDTPRGLSWAELHEKPTEKKPAAEKKLYPDERGFAMVELAYKSGDLSMVVIVPQAADGLVRVERMLTAANLRSWMGQIEKRTVQVFLPKFRVECGYEMTKPLRAMGMVRACDDRLPSAGGAQFEPMCQSKDPMLCLHIDKVLHKTFVDVSEKETEAAAATAIPMEMAPFEFGPPFLPTFRADKPFLFLIRDKATDSILFLGRMTEPSATMPTVPAAPPTLTQPSAPTPTSPTTPANPPVQTVPSLDRQQLPGDRAQPAGG
jgi:serine protease inhibitor